MKVLILLILSISGMARAYDCPQVKVSCDLKALNDKHGYASVLPKVGEFKAYNFDEPSLSPDTCEAHVQYSSEELGMPQTMNVTVHEDLMTYFYVGEGYGALDPQFYLKAGIGQEITFHYKKWQLVCSLTDGTPEVQ